MSDVYSRSLEYHRKKPYGKLGIHSLKPIESQDDFALAYTPGVAEPCRAIANDPRQADFLTSKANLVGVISNGTAVLGLGNIGALASKPVMEGKAVLFKKFANVDAFDIEINEMDPDKLIDIIASLEPTFGGINLEDIKAPECFYIEEELQKRMNIPVFHDDQHGTAIVTCAAVLNALKISNKKIHDVKIITLGAGAGAIACLDLLCKIGANKENIYLYDSKGLVHINRNLSGKKALYAQGGKEYSIEESIKGADIFLGLSGKGILTTDMVKSMGKNPLIFALSNPEPEINPHEAKMARPDSIIATGRPDFPNQVNNVVGYPYIFRGALDVGAKIIDDTIKIACVNALASLTQKEATDTLRALYQGQNLSFGPEYIIPKPFDPRLYLEVSFAVAKAAVNNKNASRPYESEGAYKDLLLKSL